MLYEHLSDTCLAARIGEGGLSDEALARALEAAGRSLAGLRRARAAGGLALLDLPSRSDDLAACRPVAEAYRERFAEVVVLGTGGSSLGGQALAALAGGGAPRLHFMDNVDPRTFEALLAGLDPARTGILAISKSGGTAETLAQLLALLPALERAGADDLAGRVTVITGAATSPLRRLAERRGFACLDHEPGVGGRFSVLSNVGALPAMIAGLDAAALRAGAGAVLDQALAAEDPAAAPPALGAALSVGLLGERRTAQSVLMPYSGPRAWARTGRARRRSRRSARSTSTASCSSIWPARATRCSP
jgi:glucose-6-phosphate isomerase